MAQVIYPRAFRVAELPNGNVFRCLNCHQSIAGDGPLNPFGEDVSAKFLDQNGNVVWGPELANLDSDGDGFTNGQELQDTSGEWKIGDNEPGNPGWVSLPGDPNSKPPSLSSVGQDNYLDYLNSNIKIQPNPVTGKQLIITLLLKNDENLKAQIFSICGIPVYNFPQLILKKGKNQIPILPDNNQSDNLPNGVYFLKIEIRDKNYFKPFIINN